MSDRLSTKIARLVVVATLVIGIGSAVAAATPTAANAASSAVWLGWGGGTEGPVQIYYTSMTCQGGHLTPSNTGYIDVDAGLFAPSYVHYNWAEELQTYTSTGWKHLSWSATHSGSGNALDLHQHWNISGIYYPTSFRAFFYIQNPLTGQWYYAGATSSSSTYCTI